jgi:hypothetical protein
MTWSKGRDVVERLLNEGSLEIVAGSSASGESLLESSSQLLKSAARESSENAEAAYVLAYDAARKACAALLAQQGLRTRSGGHHVTTELVVRAQFGGPFDAFSAMRRRRAEIEYPRHVDDSPTETEARDVLGKAQLINQASAQLLAQLPLFRP